LGAVAVSATRPYAQQLSLIWFLEMRQHKREVLLELLCFFVEDGIGACSPFVFPTTHNRVSDLFRGIVDAANLGILCFASSFFPLSAMNCAE
jgi:hypothetical protein